MKVIGKTKDGFILEASTEDVAALGGLYSHEKRFEVGDLVDMSGLFRRFHSVKIALDDIDKLRRSAQLIIDSANWVEEFRDS